MNENRKAELYKRFKNEGFDEECIKLLLRCYNVIETDQIGADYLGVFEFRGNI